MAAKMARWITEKALLLIIVLLVFDGLFVDAQGNNTSVNNTTEGSGDAEANPPPTYSSYISSGRKYGKGIFRLIFLGVFIILFAAILCCNLCCRICCNSKSNYATGENLPSETNGQYLRSANV